MGLPERSFVAGARILLRLLAALGLALPLAAAGDEGHASPPGFAGAAEAWAGLSSVRNGIARDIQRGNLVRIHAKAERVPGLARELLAGSGELDAAKRESVAAALKELEDVTETLHHAADRGEAAATREELAKLDAVLDRIHGQYPPGVLEEPAPGKGP